MTTGSNSSTVAAIPSLVTSVQGALSASSGAGEALPSSVFDYVDTLSPMQLRARALARYRQKKMRRSFVKKIRYAARKANADARPRVNGRFVKRQSIVAVCA